MKYIILLIITLLFSININGQQRRDRMGNPVISREPTEQDKERRLQEIEERKEEFINNFLTTLEADDFQKQIIKQNINSFFEAKTTIFKTQFDHSLDRKEAIKKLEETHFKELEELISENDMKKIKEMIKGIYQYLLEEQHCCLL